MSDLSGVVPADEDQVVGHVGGDPLAGSVLPSCGVLPSVMPKEVRGRNEEPSAMAGQSALPLRASSLRKPPPQDRDGMEDQLGALGLVLNAIVLWTTKYIDAAVAQLHAEGHELRDEDLAWLSPLKHRNLNLLGRYSFTATVPAAGARCATRTRRSWTRTTPAASRSRPRPADLATYAVEAGNRRCTAATMAARRAARKEVRCSHALVWRTHHATPIVQALPRTIVDVARLEDSVRPSPGA